MILSLENNIFEKVIISVVYRKMLMAAKRFTLLNIREMCTVKTRLGLQYVNRIYPDLLWVTLHVCMQPILD